MLNTREKSHLRIAGHGQLFRLTSRLISISRLLKVGVQLTLLLLPLDYSTNRNASFQKIRILLGTEASVDSKSVHCIRTFIDAADLTDYTRPERIIDEMACFAYERVRSAVEYARL